MSKRRRFIILLQLACTIALVTLAPCGSVVGGPVASAAARPISSQLFIAPSSSSLAGASAKLVVGTLSREASQYVGDYRIKVFPYFFKSESGRLAIKVPETALGRMTEGLPAEFTGRAITNGSEKTRRISAKATPSANDRGALIFTVATVEGPLVFQTSYRIGKR